MTFNIELGKQKADKSCRVYVRVSSHCTRQRIPTDVYLMPSDYTKTKKGLKIKNLEKKSAIDDVIRMVESGFAKSSISLSSATASDIVNSVKHQQESEDFIAFANSWITKCTLKGKKNYSTALNSFKRYIGKESLSFTELTPALLISYQDSLVDKPRAQSEYMAVLRHLWKEADILYDDLPRSPFRKFKPVKQKKVGQRATSIDIIRKIYEYKGRGRAMLARDCFLLSFCLMGMNSADLYDCTDKQRNVISYDRMKVRDRRADNGHTAVKIHRFIADIVKKYAGTKTVFNFSTRYSSIDTFNTALNKGLRAILGKDSGITFYSARHSWATIARNDLGIEKATVNDALCHVDKDMSVTDLYIKKDYKLINDANKKVIEYVFSPYL